MNMQIGQLRAYLAVAEQRHFTRAARELGMAQPSVSAHVRRLEAELGTELFDRMKGKITLTPAGETLLPFARRIIADVDAAADELRSLGGLARGRITIGATPSLAATLVPAVLSRFHAAYPGIELAIRQAGSVELVAAVEEGAIDIALVILPIRHDVLETQALLREELVVAVPMEHRLAGRDVVRLADLASEPFVAFRIGSRLRELLDSASAAAGFEPRIALESNESRRIRSLVSSSLGVAILPRSDATGPGAPVAVTVLVEPSLTRDVTLAARTQRRLSPAALAFRELTLETFVQPSAIMDA